METEHKIQKHKERCDMFKKFLLKTFLFLRYYVDILIDCAFGYYFKTKRQTLPSSANPLLLESATSIAKKIKKRQLRSEDVVTVFIERIREVNPIINALVDNCFDDALEEARRIDRGIEDNTITDVDFQHKPFLGKCKDQSFNF